MPVIFLSALDDAADKIAGLGLGAVDYVTKPIQPEEVRARVDNHLTRLFLDASCGATAIGWTGSSPMPPSCSS